MTSALRLGLVAVVAVCALVGVLFAVAAGRSSAQSGDDLIVEEISVDGASFRLERLAGSHTTPLWGESPPYGIGVLYVADQVGTITALATDGGDAEPHTFLDVGPAADVLVPPKTEGSDERGLLGMAFHPHYRKNGLVYTYTSEPLGPEPDFTTLADSDARDEFASLSVVREWRVDDPRRTDAVVDLDSSRVLLSIEQPQSNHNAGAIVFGPDAMLYVALGDGGNRDDEGLGHAPGGNGQDLSEGNLLGKILRIDPRGDDSANGAYGIPADNPFVDAEGADEIFAHGFRNPFRMSFDHRSGDLYVADVGQRDIEEVSIVTSGGNYGWPVKEGTFLFESQSVQDRGFATIDSPGEPPDMIDPVVQYDHDEGISVTGGFVYHGAELPQLAGSYVFGDFTLDGDLIAGRIFRLDPVGALTELVATNNDDNRLLITGFGRDTEGELYVMGIGASGGVVYRMAPAQ